MLKLDKHILIILLMLTMLITAPAYGEENSQELTLQNALNKAFLNSPKLLSGNLEIDKLEIQRDHAKQSMLFTPIDYVFNPQDANTFKAFYGVDFEYRNAEKKLESNRKQLIIDVTTAYHQVIRNQEALEVAKITQAKELVKLGQAKAKLSVGMISQIDLLAAESQYSASLSKIKEAETKLINAYNELNKLMGQELSKRPILVDPIQYQETTLDAETEAQKAVNNSYEMWSAEEAAKLAEQMKYFEYWSDIGKKSENQANITALDTKTQIRIQTKSLCNGIEQMEALQNQLYKQVIQLEENLRVVQLQSKLGLVTRDIVLTVELALKEAKNASIDVASQHTTAVLTLKRLTGELDTSAFK